MRWSGAMIVLSNPRGERKKASPDLCMYVENNATCPSAMGYPVRISSSGSHLGTAGIQLNDFLLQKQNFILTVLKHQNSSRQGSLKANRFGSLSLLLFYLSHLKQVQQLWKFPFSMAEFILIWSWRSRPTKSKLISASMEFSGPDAYILSMPWCSLWPKGIHTSKWVLQFLEQDYGFLENLEIWIFWWVFSFI